MAPLLFREGEGKKTILLGPDPWSFRITGADVDGRFDFIEATISYLQGPRLHIHHEQDDTFFVIDGTLTVQVGDELFDLGRGDLVCAPKGVPHTQALEEVARKHKLVFVGPTIPARLGLV